MSPVTLDAPTYTGHSKPLVTTIDDRRGSFGMALLITTEAFLFATLFAAYYYLGPGTQRWKIEEPPKLHYSIPMLIILLTASAVFHWGELQLKKGRYGAARAGLIGTIILGCGFIVMSYFEYAESLQTLSPKTDSYGSIFYTIISLHLLHLIVGLVMLSWVLTLPRWEPLLRPSHHPYHNAGMYWHFVDTMWVFIVAILYVYPNIVH